MKNEILEAARAGNIAAQEKLRESLRPRMESMAGYYASRTGMDSADLLQEAWLAVFEVLPTLDTTIGTPSQFLLKHARWQILDHIRWNKRRSHEMLDDTLAESASFAASSPSGASSASAAGSAWGAGSSRPGTSDVETGMMVEALQEKLTVRQQAILVGLMDGQTWRQIGDSLGCTSANIAYHVRGIRQAYGEMVGLSDLGDLTQSGSETHGVSGTRGKTAVPGLSPANIATRRNSVVASEARIKQLA